MFKNKTQQTSKHEFIDNCFNFIFFIFVMLQTIFDLYRMYESLIYITKKLQIFFVMFL